MSESTGINVSKKTAASTETFKELYNMLNNRECGGLEIMDDLCGHRNFGFDRGHTFIPNVRWFKKRKT
jgi:hypothetical protein